MLKIITLVTGLLFSFVANAHIHESVKAEAKAQVQIDSNESQITALADAYKREFTSKIKSDTDELLAEALIDGKITPINFNEYDEYNNSNNIFVKDFIKSICAVEKKSCPEVYYTTKENVLAAAMYPTGFMLINENIHNILDRNATKYLMAHELGHWFLNHSKRKLEVASRSIVENGILVDGEKMVYMLTFIPGMIDFQRQVEAEADQYAFSLLKKLNIDFDCNKAFEKMLNGQKESAELHHSFEHRCAQKQ